MADTDYADEYGHEPVPTDDHDLDACPNCGSEFVVEDRHGTVDELDIDCAGCGRSRDGPDMPTMEDILGETDPDSRTSILAYEPEVSVMKRAKRELERELDEDIPLHTALTIFSEMYLESRGSHGGK